VTTTAMRGGGYAQQWRRLRVVAAVVAMRGGGGYARQLRRALGEGGRVGRRQQHETRKQAQHFDLRHGEEKGKKKKENAPVFRSRLNRRI
jgi:hypothetical protein